MNRAALALITLIIPAAGSAHRFDGERAWDRHEAKQYRREVRDDRRDLRRMERLLSRFDDAVSYRSRYALAAVEGDVLRTLDREIREARWGLTPFERYSTTGDRYVHCDHGDLRDDRRDLVKLQAIRSELGYLLGRVDRRAIERKRALVAELVTMARFEPREDRAERREVHEREAWYHGS